MLAWCNSKSLELAGIHAGTRVEGGTVLLKNGEPSGILIDNAMDRVSALIPPPARDLQVRALLAAQEKCFRAGLTSVTDCGLPADIILLMDSLQKQGLLKIRINAMIKATQRSKVALSINLTGGVFVNQSAAFSDYHGTGGNPGANASYTDLGFVANRFVVVQYREHA